MVRTFGVGDYHKWNTPWGRCNLVVRSMPCRSCLQTSAFTSLGWWNRRSSLHITWVDLETRESSKPSKLAKAATISAFIDIFLLGRVAPLTFCTWFTIFLISGSYKVSQLRYQATDRGVLLLVHAHVTECRWVHLRCIIKIDFAEVECGDYVACWHSCTSQEYTFWWRTRFKPSLSRQLVSFYI